MSCRAFCKWITTVLSRENTHIFGGLRDFFLSFCDLKRQAIFDNEWYATSY